MSMLCLNGPAQGTENTGRSYSVKPVIPQWIGRQPGTVAAFIGSKAIGFALCSVDFHLIRHSSQRKYRFPELQKRPLPAHCL